MRSRGSYVLARLEQFFDDTIVLASRDGELPVVEALREYASYIALTESFFEAVRWYSLVRDHRELRRGVGSSDHPMRLAQSCWNGRCARALESADAGHQRVRGSVIDEDPRGFVINPVLDEEIIEAGRTGAIQTVRALKKDASASARNDCFWRAVLADPPHRGNEYSVNDKV
ncbi:hypothetical protein PHYSODRAFT_307875 [Phytophthora sojae]|uniref:Uncharacterized protein n=1 Tax=Phytophthora sojae (strain P6497) TaxID=1094619 RepID=G5AGM5_PHYSP|nr:hypothetical protein PHYSODRAFT_307875 [Phytophthora sojae]EGZ05305.1 hypothetical protein PHYSODRAFT_307875 [Phytophthora sojae]|eukprot:XP_009539226.1 hypothetical protein PHYSODRAFT_307875 [Phytophthora sojae]